AALTQRQAKLRSLHEGIAVAVAADPVADAQEARRSRAQLPFPPGIEGGKNRQEDIAKIGQDILDLVRDERSFAAERARLPEQRDLPADGCVEILAVLGFSEAGVAQGHERGNAVAV